MLPPCLVVSAAHHLSGAGAVRGTGGHLLSAPDALAGELGLGVQAWSVRVYGPPRRVVSCAHGRNAPRPIASCHGAGPSPGDRRLGGRPGHQKWRPDVDPRHRMGVH